MRSYRITGIRLLVLLLGGMAVLTAGLGTLVALWAPKATALDQRKPAVERPCSPADPCLAVIIDDIGRDPGVLARLLGMSTELTFAVLPHAPHTESSLRAIEERGAEVLLHLPMMPLDEQNITDEQVVLGREEPLRAALQTCLERVPAAVGVNNHMGSALGRDPIAVDQLLRIIGRRKLWFLDSRTDARSLFCQQARLLNVPCLQRDLFLDDPAQLDAVLSRFSQAVQIAHDRGWAVAIGHPLQTTVDALQRVLVRSTVRIRRLSAIVAARDAT